MLSQDESTVKKEHVVQMAEEGCGTLSRDRTYASRKTLKSNRGLAG